MEIYKLTPARRWGRPKIGGTQAVVSSASLDIGTGKAKSVTLAAGDWRVEIEADAIRKALKFIEECDAAESARRAGAGNGR